MTAPIWTVILAAGAGRRLASLTGGTPKQFWRGPGGTSLLDDTLERFAPLSARSNTVVVVDSRHRRHLDDSTRRCGTTIYQPRDRGTAAGVLLALVPVLAEQPDAIVVVTPSDHGVSDDAMFLEGLREAERHVTTSGGVVVFSVTPTAPREDYGWILPGPSVDGSPLRRVAAFFEKPERPVAERLFRRGASWNTMVTVGRAAAIRDLCFRFVPELEAAFTPVIRRPQQQRDAIIEAAYSALPAFDFSRHVLTPARDLTTYIWPASLGWSDLGTPERLISWHAQSYPAIGRVPVTAA